MINTDVVDLLAENGNLKQLLCDLLPDIEARVQGLNELFPGRDVLLVAHRNETHVVRIKKALAEFECQPYSYK